jgi:hypothetical protein
MVTFRSVVVFTTRRCQLPSQRPSFWTTLCRLSAIDYSISPLSATWGRVMPCWYGLSSLVCTNRFCESYGDSVCFLGSLPESLCHVDLNTLIKLYASLTLRDWVGGGWLFHLNALNEITRWGIPAINAPKLLFYMCRWEEISFHLLKIWPKVCNLWSFYK